MLAPGDVIYLYTDGITEQADPQGELFGETRLKDILSASRLVQNLPEITEAVLVAVSMHAGAEEQSDDRTQLVIRYCGVKGKDG